MLRFKKIKYNGEKVVLHWTTSKVMEEVAHELISTQTPHPRLVDTLAAFVPEVLDLLELPADYDVGLRVVGLSINTQEDGRRGLVVTCLKALEGAQGPLVLNTPNLPEPGDDAQQPSLPSTMLRLMERAEREAEAFVNGKRAQVDMFADADEREPATAGV